MNVKNLATAPIGRNLRIEGPGIPAMTLSGDGNIGESMNSMQGLPGESVLLGVKDECLSN